MQGSQYINSHANLKSETVWFNAKLVSQFLVFSVLLSNPFYISYLHAAPVGGNIVGGSGKIQRNELTTTINQSSQNLAVNWQSFDVNVDEKVNFVQPNSSSIALNRILGNNGSTIQGQINANGQVILVNPNGVLFTSTATVNAGGLIASSLDMSPTDFMNGSYIFNEVIGADGSVINSGIINASLGGNVALIGKQVKNEGLISANLGSVILAAGKQSVLTFDNQGLIGVSVTKEVLQDEIGVEASVVNSGEINASGGRVLLTASSSQDVFSQAVNNSAVEPATSVVVHEDGTFTLGGGADVVNTGSIDVSSQTNENNSARIILLGENVTSSGTIQADTEVGNGGEIELHAIDTTLLTENSHTSSQATKSGVGGLVKVLGNKVGLFDNAEVNVSGVNGGGQALIGGDYQGINSLISNASKTLVGINSVIKADAFENGNGGRVIVWADDITRFGGNISATGGFSYGDGGFAEVSGKNILDYQGFVNLTATNGLIGTLLLDPKNITISDAATSGGVTFPDDFNDFDDNTLNLTLNNQTLSRQLQGSNVTLEAQNDIDITHNINEAAANNTSGGLENRLRLRAGRSIKIAAGVDITLDDADFEAFVNHDSDQVLNANRDIDELAVFSMGTGSSITTNGGDINIESRQRDDSRGAAGLSDDLGDYTIETLNSSGSAGRDGGNIFILNHEGSITLNSTVSSNGGSSTTFARSARDIEIYAGQNVTVNGNITANGGVVTGAANRNGGDGGLISIFSGAEATTQINLNADINANGSAGINGGDDGEGGTININTPKLVTSGDRTISATGDNPTNSTVGDINIYYDGMGDTFGVNAFTIKDLLLNGNLTIETGRYADINLRQNIDYDGLTAAGTLLLKAGNHIRLNKISDTVTTSADQLTVTLNANTDSAWPGNVELFDSISTGNGVFTATGRRYLGRSYISGGFREVTVNTGTGNAFITTSRETLLGKMIVGGNLTVSAGTNTSDQYGVISQGQVNNGFDILDVTGTATFNVSGTTANDYIDLTNNNLFKGQINLATNTGAVSDIVDSHISLRNTHTSTTLNNVTSYGNLTVDATGNLTVASGGTIRAISSDTGTTGVIRTINLNFGLNDVAGTIDSTFTSTGATFQGNTLGGDDFVDLNITGSTGHNVFNVNNSASSPVVTNFTDLRNVTVTGNAGNDSFNFNNSVAGNSIDFTNINTWTVNGNAGLDIFNTENINFTSVANIAFNGGSEKDTFNIRTDIAGTSTGALNGGAGNDDFNILATGLTITNINGDGGTDKIVAANELNVWDVTADNAGAIYSAATKLANEKRLDFSSIENLTGNANVDQFDLAADVASEINGLAGADIFNVSSNITGVLSGGDDNDTFNINATNLIISQQIQGGNGTDELVGANELNVWDITAQNTGAIYSDLAKTPISQRLSFAGIETLTGNADVDRFDLAFDITNSVSGLGGADIFNIDTDVTGSMSGGLGGDTFNISSDYTGLLTAGEGNDTFEIMTTGLVLSQQLNGGLGTDELIAANELNVWDISATNEGTIFADTGKSSQRLTFTDFEVLTGNASVDRFDLASDVSNQVNGMGGLDIFNITFNTTGALNGGDGVDTFNIDSDFSGSANGGTGNDIFEINTSVTGTGVLNGDGGDDSFDINATALSIASIDGGANGTSGDKITAFDETNYWNISDAGSGTIADSAVAATRVTFAGIENLTGGDNNNDTFVFSTLSSSIDGLIDGGVSAGDNDIVDLSLVGLTNNVILGATAGYTNIEEFIGNGTNSTITGENFDTTWTFTADNTGKVSYSTDGGATTTESLFTNFAKLNGGSAVDTFELTFDVTSEINGNGGDDIYNITTDITGVMNGGDGNDVFNINALNLSITSIVGGNTLETTGDVLNAFDETNYWDITGAGSGTIAASGIAAPRLTFAGIENIKGGDNNNDTFVFSDLTSSISGVIDGGDSDGDNDIVDLSLADLVNDITLGPTVGYTNIEEFIGNGTNSTITGENFDTTWTFTADNTGKVSYSTDGGATTTESLFTNFAKLNGGSAVDTFELTFDVTSEINGNGGNDIYNVSTGITGTMNGGAGDDIFNINALNLSIASIIGGDTVETTGDVLNAFDETNYWNISDTGQGTIAASSVAATRLGFAGIENMVGGDQVDDFNLANAITNAGNIQGGLGVNSLTAGNDVNFWDITSQNTGSIYTDSTRTTKRADFSGIEILNGNASIDEFNLAFDVTNQINGLAGNDIFTIGTTITGAIDGGAGTDTLTAENAANYWNITAQNTGGIFTDSTLATQRAGFASIEILNGNGNVDEFNLAFDITNQINGLGGNDIFTLGTTITGAIDGGAGTDTLTAENAANYWNITAQNTGDIYTDSTLATQRAGFASIETLNGNGNVDEFNLAFDVTNQINGLAGNDIFTIGTTITGAIDGGAGTDTLTAANVANFWDITAVNTGSIYTDSTRATKRLDFSSIETLNGNDNTDRFNLAFDVTNEINGLGGSDRFDIGVEIAGAINGGAANDSFYITSTGLVLPQIIQGGTGTDSLYAANENNYWNLNNAGAGGIFSNPAMTVNRVTFNGMERVFGNAAVDTFLLNGTNNFAGSINGGGGVDKLTAGTRSNNWAISTATSGTVSGNTFSSIEELVGGGSDDHLQLHNSIDFAGTFDGAGGVDEIIGGDRPNTWEITEENAAQTEVAGTVTGLTGTLTGFTSGSFKNVETLTGNNNSDDYSLLADVTFNGSINGLGGDNSLTAGNFATNTWTINASNTGTVTGLAGTFSSIQSITGGTFIDEFNFGANGFITGLIDGNDISAVGDSGRDVVNITAITDSTTVKLGIKTTYETAVLNIENVEQINASDSGASVVNTIVGDDRPNTWVITADNTGYVQETDSTNTETRTDFSNFEIVHGGDLDDAFQFQGASKITNTIDGRGGVNSIDYSAVTGAVEVNLNDTGTGDNTIVNVTGVKGNKTQSTLFAKNGQDNTWDFYGTNRGEVDGVVFTDFNILEGGDQVDTFNFNGASPEAMADPIVQNIGLQIKGNADNDRLNVNLTGAESTVAGTGGINFDGGASTNELRVTGGDSSYNATYTSNVALDTDRLSYSSDTNTFEVNYKNTASVQDDLVANTLELVGTNASDTFTLTNSDFNVTGTGPLPAYTRTENITYSGKTNITVTGGVDDILEIPAPLTNSAGEYTFDIETINDNGNLITALALNLKNTSTTVAHTLNTNIDRFSAENTGDLFIIENDGINLTGLNTSNILDITANGTVSSSAVLDTSTQASLVIDTGATGNITLNNASNRLLGTLELTAPGNVNITNSAATSIAGITSGSLDIDSTGDITQTGEIRTGSTRLISNSNITLALGNDFSSLDIPNAVNVRVNDINSLTIGSIDASGSVNITSNGLTLGTISSSDITLNSGSGSIVGSGTNFDRDGTVVLTANGGISVDLAMNGSLTATNSDSGNIDVTKTGDVVLEDITQNNNTSGGFSLVSNGGDVTIKKVTLDKDDPLAEARFTFTDTGSVYGDTTSSPHISANRLVFDMRLSGSVGRSNAEPIITDVKDYIEVTGALGTYIRYLNGVFDGEFVGENEYKNIALQIIENIAGQQLIEVETLAEIDPAIFTDVRNYSNSDIALMMPSDQRYDISDEEEEDQEAKERRQKFLNSTP